MSNKGWIAVDFDGTLAAYDKWVDCEHCGAPISLMVARVKCWLAEGREVRIFTARVFPVTEVIDANFPVVDAIKNSPHLTGRDLEAAKAAAAIQRWCRDHIGQVLPITCVKDYAMIELYDDRAVQVLANTGELVGHSTRGL